jgi:hypothetical protein
MTRHQADDAVLADMDAFLENACRDGSSALPLPVRLAGAALQAASPAALRAVSRAATRRMLRGRQTVACAMTTVSEIIQAQGLSNVGLLKVDVERAELEVLRGVDPLHWPRIDQAALEVHAEALPGVLGVLRGAAGFDCVVSEQGSDMRGTSIHMVFARRRRRREPGSNDAL